MLVRFLMARLASTGNTQICMGDSLGFNITNTENNSPGTNYFFYINDGTESQFFKHPPPAVVGHRFAKSSCSALSDDDNQVFTQCFWRLLIDT